MSEILQNNPEEVIDTGINSDEEYLNKKLEKRVIPKVLKGKLAERRLSRIQHDNIEGADEEYPLHGEVYYDKENYHFSLKYEGAHSTFGNGIPFKQSRLCQLEESGPNRRDEVDRRYKFIKNLEIVDQSKQGRDRFIFRLDDELHHGYQMFFEPTDRIASGATDISGHLALIRGNPETPSFFITMLHELGHLQEYRLLTDEERQPIRDIGSGLIEQDETKKKEAAAIFLRTERNAWAYALNKLRPLFSTKNKEGFISRDDVIKEVDYCLSSYSAFIRAALSKNLKELVFSFFQ